MIRARVAGRITAAAMLLGGCFSGDFLDGLPCTSDDDCGPGGSCENGFCGGRPASGTSTNTTTATTTSPTTSAVTTEPTTTVGTSTTDPTGTSGTTGCVNPPCGCPIPAHTPCDQATTAPLRAIGLNCLGENPASEVVDANIEALGIRFGQFGGTSTYDPREGNGSLVLGTGPIADLENAASGCSTDFMMPLNDLPPPLTTTPVAGDCIADPMLVGTGDCSNTLDTQVPATISDYAALAVSTRVPPGIDSFSVDVAFLTTEYPESIGMNFNDAVVVWLESERWTGNIAFDMAGNAISVNSGLLSILDDAMNRPEFTGTCMVGDGATRWLRSSAPVSPDEDITVVFAVFDGSDGLFNSYAFVDNFQWGCDGDEPPRTIAAG